MHSSFYGSSVHALAKCAKSAWRKKGQTESSSWHPRMKLQTLFTNLTLSLPAHEHWACKSFSCKGLGQPPLAPFQKSSACFRKTEGTSRWGESWLFLCISLSGGSGQWPLSGLFLFALRVVCQLGSAQTSRHLVLLFEIQGSLDHRREAGLYHRRAENRKRKQQQYFLDTLSSISDVCQALTRLSAACVTVHTRFWLLCLLVLLWADHCFSSKLPRCFPVQNLLLQEGNHSP